MKRSPLGGLLLLGVCAACTGGEPGKRAQPAASGGASAPQLEPFSFFVTSYAAMQRLSGTENGFGGDLRYGQPDGLSGADKICSEIAEASMPGAGRKRWRAFLSVTKGPEGAPVHAIDRVGQGPWYDRLGRLVAMTRDDLLLSRPKGDPAISDDLPNEDGVPNHNPDGLGDVDNHDILTGSDKLGHLYKDDGSNTCQDWTSSEGSAGRPRVGHSWPRDFRAGAMGPGGMSTRPPGAPPRGGAPGGFPFPTGGGFPAGFMPGEADGVNWISSLNEAGCAAGASLVEMGPPDQSNPTVGSGGGYGGIYCFALEP